MELEWLKRNLSCSDAHERRKLVDLGHGQLTISRQCQSLGLARSTNYSPVPVRDSILEILARIDAIYLGPPEKVNPESGSTKRGHA